MLTNVTSCDNISLVGSQRLLWHKRWVLSHPHELVLIGMRVHLFPSRTQKLSSYSPTILGWWRPGKIGNANMNRTLTSAVFCFNGFCLKHATCDFNRHTAWSDGSMCLPWEYKRVISCEERVLMSWMIVMLPAFRYLKLDQVYFLRALKYFLVKLKISIDK